MLEVLHSWIPWIAAGGAIAGLVGWAIGLSKVISIISTLLDVLAPILKGISTAIVAFLGWCWHVFIWPDNPRQPSFRRGITDICDDWVTILTAAGLMWGVYMTMDWKVDKVVDQLGTCQTEIVRLKKAAEKLQHPQEQPSWWWSW